MGILKYVLQAPAILLVLLTFVVSTISAFNDVISFTTPLILLVVLVLYAIGKKMEIEE